MKYSKAGAVRILVADAQNPRSTRASYLRCVGACNSLGLSDPDRRELLQSWCFNYIDKHGLLYPRYEKKVKA